MRPGDVATVDRIAAIVRPADFLVTRPVSGITSMKHVTSMKIGVISDTHGWLDPKLFRLFAGVEHILHAGDIGSDGIAVGLEAVAPVTAVLGNTDSSPIFRLTEVVALAGRKFLVHHIVNPRALDRGAPAAHRARAAGRGGVRPHAQGVLRND